MNKLGIVGTCALIIVACSSKHFTPTDQQLTVMQQKVPGITLEEAKTGYKLYSEKCAGCHQLYRPAKYTIAQWNNVLPKMFPKAKLVNQEQQKLIRDYLHASSKG